MGRGQKQLANPGRCRFAAWKEPPRDHLSLDALHVWRVPLRECAQAADWRLLSKQELERAQRFAHDRDREAWVQTRSWWRRILSRHLGIPAADIEVRQGPLGAPYPVPFIAQNLSHTRGLALVIVAPVRRDGVGIDVERIRAIDTQALCAHTYSASEELRYRHVSAHASNNHFFQVWTRKEAWLKAMGCGLRLPMPLFSVSLEDPGPISSARLPAGMTEGWATCRLQLHAPYVAAIAYKGELPTIHLWSLDEP